MLHGIHWDGVNRLPVLLDILHIDGGSFYALLVRKWLIQCVALVHNTYRRQETAEGVLVLQGPKALERLHCSAVWPLSLNGWPMALPWT